MTCPHWATLKTLKSEIFGKLHFLIWEQMRDWKISGPPSCPILWTTGNTIKCLNTCWKISVTIPTFVVKSWNNCMPAKERGERHTMIALMFLNHLLLPFSLISRILGLGSVGVMPRKTFLKNRLLGKCYHRSQGLVLSLASLMWEDSSRGAHKSGINNSARPFIYKRCYSFSLLQGAPFT